MKNNRILPNGFYDLVDQEAKKHYEYTKLAIDNFINNDYKLIKTSMIEYSNNYCEKDLAKIFKFADPITREQIFFRHDITMQIANYIESRRDFDSTKIHKYCYYGDSIDLNCDTPFSQRQQTQVGCEIINDSSIDSCYKIISDNLQILKNIDQIKIFVSLPDFMKVFLTAIDQQDNDNLRNAIINKNISEIKKIDKINHQLINEIILNNFNHSHLFSQIIDSINNLQLQKMLNMAIEIKNLIERNYSNIEIFFDLFGDHNISYHHKIAFNIYANNFQHPLVKGGCYLISQGNSKIDAVGATIYVNNLRKI